MDEAQWVHNKYPVKILLEGEDRLYLGNRDRNPSLSFIISGFSFANF